jgi:hypothetical protein
LWKEQCHQHADYELADDRPDGEQRCVDQGLGEQLVGHHGDVVLKPHPRSLAVDERPQRVVLEAHQQVLHDR